MLSISEQGGATIAVGSKIGSIAAGEGGGKKKEPEAQTEAKKQRDAPQASGGEKPTEDTYATSHPSPAASKVLAEKGVNPKEVQGTGRDGRITKPDAVGYKAPGPETEPVIGKEEAASCITGNGKNAQQAPPPQKEAGW